MAEKYDLDKDPDYITHMELSYKIQDFEFQALCYKDEAEHCKIKGDETRYNECLLFAEGYEHQAQELRKNTQ